MGYKEDIQKAVLNHSRKQIEPETISYRKNSKPEEKTNSELRAWFKKNNWLMSRVESKGEYSIKLQRFIKSETETGHSDWSGCTPQGLGAFVEAKAKGKRYNLSERQREFLIKRIKAGAFACVTDSVEHLEALIKKYLSQKTREARIDVLFGDVPRTKSDNTPIF